MSKYQLFCENQHGYILVRSTNTAIFKYKNVINLLENYCLAFGTFLYLTKAYDCLTHEYLVVKLERYGIRGPALKWISSYLSNCRQK